jgi:SAM-dependent methyltransferase
MDTKPADNDYVNEWDTHWKALDAEGSLFSFVATATRRFIFQPAVAHYADRFFAKTGVFVEMGCGTAHSSARVARHDRKLIGLDFSSVALSTAQKSGLMNMLIQADIFALPCRPTSLDGIWNLGVMEHFTQAEIASSLQEFRGILKPGGVIILFWPAKRNASRWILGPVEWVISRWKRAKFTFFPGEISLIESKPQARLLIEAAGFKINTIDFDWRTAFIHMVIVATKA